MQSNNNREETKGPLICMRDNVSASAENPRCPHPSSSCPFRELCVVKEAMQHKKHLETELNANVDCRGSGVFRRRKKP